MVLLDGRWGLTETSEEEKAGHGVFGGRHDGIELKNVDGKGQGTEDELGILISETIRGWCNTSYITYLPVIDKASATSMA